MSEIETMEDTVTQLTVELERLQNRLHLQKRLTREHREAAVTLTSMVIQLMGDDVWRGLNEQERELIAGYGELPDPPKWYQPMRDVNVKGGVL